MISHVSLVCYIHVDFLWNRYVYACWFDRGFGSLVNILRSILHTNVANLSFVVVHVIRANMLEYQYQ
jgi:hypothetical protein